MKPIKFLLLFIVGLLFCSGASGYENNQKSFLQYSLVKSVAVVPMSAKQADDLGMLWAVSTTVDKEPSIIGARKDGKFVVIWFVQNDKISTSGVKQMNDNPEIAFFSFSVDENMTGCVYINSWTGDVSGDDLDAFFGLVSVAINVSKK